MSRVGLIYLPDEERALAGMRHALRQGGRVAAVVHSTPDRNPFFALPVKIVRERARLPPPLPGQPGPFSLGADGVLEAAFAKAAFTDIAVRRVPWAVRLPGRPSACASSASRSARWTPRRSATRGGRMAPRRVPRVGDAAEEILRASHAADPVVLGAHGRGSLADVVTGGTAGRVVRRCRKRLLVAKRPADERPCRWILVRVDFSAGAEAALALAGSVSRQAAIDAPPRA